MNQPTPQKNKDIQQTSSAMNFIEAKRKFRFAAVVTAT